MTTEVARRISVETSNTKICSAVEDSAGPCKGDRCTERHTIEVELRFGDGAKILERMMGLLLPSIRTPDDENSRAISRRLRSIADAWVMTIFLGPKTCSSRRWAFIPMDLPETT